MSLADRLPKLPQIKIGGPIAGLAAAVLAAAVVALALPQDAPLTQLQVRGPLVKVRPEDVRAAADLEPGASFFQADVARVRDAVGDLPWVARASVERVWPGSIMVRVWEREAYARWNEDGLLDTDSRAFVPRAAEIPTGLPRLGGVAGHEAEVAAAWKRLAPPLADTPLRLTGLVIDARGEWTAQAANGIELRLGADAPDRHLAMLTGVVQRTLGGRWGDVQYIDLRYTNGFAVGWAKPQLQPPATKAAAAKGGAGTQ